MRFIVTIELRQQCYCSQEFQEYVYVSDSLPDMSSVAEFFISKYPEKVMDGIVRVAAVL